MRFASAASEVNSAQPYPFAFLKRSLALGPAELLRAGGAAMRMAVVAAVMCLSIIGLSAADEVKASIRKDTNIPAGGLGPALQTLAKDFGFQVLYRTEI